jgi:hypothetical protein
VVRGNTYAAQVLDSTLQLHPPAAAQRAAAPRPAKPLARGHSSSAARRRAQSGQPEPLVNGRTHMMVQTDDYLEELVDQIFEQDSGTQTEAAEELPVPPIFVPRPIGEDMATSIEPGELFDFELAVEPCLEVVVGKALEQALMEVLEEEELARLRDHRQHFRQERDQIIAEAQRMEAQSLRHHQEKERRVQQERERVAAEREVARKAAARTAAKHFMSGLQASVVSSLQAAGHLYDPVQRQVDGIFMPWLLESVASKLVLVEQARAEVDGLIGTAVAQLHKEVDDKLRADAAEAQRRAEEAAEALRVAEEARRAAQEAEAARVAKEAADAAEAARKESEENAEDDEDEERDEVEEGDEEDEDEE